MLKEWIIRSFVAQESLRTMSRIYLHLIRERQDLRDDAAHQRRVVAPLEVGAPHGAAHNRIAGKDNLCRFAVKADSTQGMAGSEQRNKGCFTKSDGRSVGKVYLVWHLFKVELITAAVEGAGAVDIFVCAAKGKRNPVPFFEEPGTTNVVVVAMSSHYDTQADIVPVDEICQCRMLLWVVVAWVHDHPLPAGIPHYVSILAEGIEYEPCNLEHIHR